MGIIVVLEKAQQKSQVEVEMVMEEVMLVAKGTVTADGDTVSLWSLARQSHQSSSLLHPPPSS